MGDLMDIKRWRGPGFYRHYEGGVVEATGLSVDQSTGRHINVILRPIQESSTRSDTSTRPIDGVEIPTQFWHEDLEEFCGGRLVGDDAVPKYTWVGPQARASGRSMSVKDTFIKGFEREIGSEVDRELAIKLIARAGSSLIVYGIYRRLGAKPWQAFGLVTITNQLLGISRTIKAGQPQDTVIGVNWPGGDPATINWTAMAKSFADVFPSSTSQEPSDASG